MSTPRSKAKDDPRLVALAGYAVIILTFGVVGGWAATAPLASAVVANGVMMVETNRKTVQHFEGGIISKINVREGDSVTAGQVLFRLDETQPKANLEILTNQLIGAVARDARLVAELNGKEQLIFPEEIVRLSDDLNVARTLADQEKQFIERRASLGGQISVLEARASQLRQEINGSEETKRADEQQVRFIDNELGGVRELYEQQLVTKSRWLTLERERSRLDGEIGRLVSEKAKSEKAIGESQMQIAQLKQQFQEQVSKELAETREKIGDLRNKQAVARDVLRRLDVVAPVTGRIQGLRIFTIGAVIRPGDPLVEIVPEKEKLIVQAQIQVNDIEGISVDRKAEVRFPAFNSKTLPMIPGTLVSLSHDRLMDEASKQPYYLALIDVRDEDIPAVYRGRTFPGLAVEVIIPSMERTMLNYLVEPLHRRLRTVAREK